MAQSVKGLLCTPEGLRPICRTHIAQLGEAAHACVPSAGKERQMDPEDYLVTHSNYTEFTWGILDTLF